MSKATAQSENHYTSDKTHLSYLRMWQAQGSRLQRLHLGVQKKIWIREGKSLLSSTRTYVENDYKMLKKEFAKCHVSSSSVTKTETHLSTPMTTKARQRAVENYGNLYWKSVQKKEETLLELVLTI